MISLLIAVDENFGFAYKGGLPWKCQEDLNNFKKLTDNKTVIMGRKTWESIPQKFFSKNKKCIIVTNDKDYKSEYNVTVIHSTKNLSHGFLIGGKQLIMSMLDKISEIHLTVVKGKYECDTYFEDLKDILKNYKLISSVESRNCVYYLYSH